MKKRITYLLLRLVLSNTLLLPQAYAGQLAERGAQYEQDPKVQKTLNFLHNKVLSTSQGLCATYVREGFMASGLIDSHPGISYAKNYHPYFISEGWSNVLLEVSVKKDLFKSPAGCAVVYDAIDPKNDRNGHIGHIEVRTKHKKGNGFISDYFSKNPRSGLECIRPGKKVKKLRTFTARSGSPYFTANKAILRYIEVTLCDEYSSRGAIESDEFTNRKATGVFCKMEN
jgi:hypothetical protein